MRKIFITGATGFIGRSLISKLAGNKNNKLFCLTRQNIASLTDAPNSKNIHFLRGSLFDSHVYVPFLENSDVVIHLAALTGKARVKDYFKTNAEGTRLIVDECRKSSIGRLIYMSSIAVKFKNISNYYYAHSKMEGEIAVMESRLNYTIVRPTIVIGQEAPAWRNLAKLAKKPYPFIFGNGKAKIQPIFIEDLVTGLLSIIDDKNALEKEIDLGGAEVIEFETFIKKIFYRYYGKHSKVVHIPLTPILKIIGIFEKFFYDYLPINTGQLSPFYNDSVIEENKLHDQIQPKMLNIEQMIDIVVNCENVYNNNLCLENECKVFSKYLINMNPNSNVLKHYRNAHRKQLKSPDQQYAFFDSALLYIARIKLFGTGLVDAYTSVFFKKARVCQKLILLLAILECSHPYYQTLDTPSSRRFTIVCLNTFKSAISYAAILLLASLLLGPLQLACYFRSKLLNRLNKAI